MACRRTGGDKLLSEAMLEYCWTNFKEIFIKIYKFSFRKMYLKIEQQKWKKCGHFVSASCANANWWRLFIISYGIISLPSTWTNAGFGIPFLLITTGLLSCWYEWPYILLCTMIPELWQLYVCVCCVSVSMCVVCNALLYSQKKCRTSSTTQLYIKMGSNVNFG